MNPDVLIVDGGDFLHRAGHTKLPEMAMLWQEMERTNYDAITFGELEFNQWALVESLMAVVDLPIVCTNVERELDGEWHPIGVPYRILDRQGIKIGIVSMIDKVQLSDVSEKKANYKVRLMEPMKTVQSTIDGIRDQVDMVVMIAHLDHKAMESIAATITGVDVVVGGHMTRKDESPFLAGATIVNRSGTRGQHLANTRLILSPDNAIVDFGGRNITLTADFPEDPRIADEALAAQSRSSQLRKERNALKKNPSSNRTIRNQKIDPNTPKVKVLTSPTAPHTGASAPE
jgi:5'-nucleotidase / UDP-sugar diphosphatase